MTSSVHCGSTESVGRDCATLTGVPTLQGEGRRGTGSPGAEEQGDPDESSVLTVGGSRDTAQDSLTAGIEARVTSDVALWPGRA